MPLLEVNGVRLAVEEAGSGPPLVLVHGSWDDVTVWGSVRDALAESFRVVTYDRRGHTSSEDGPTPGTRRDDEDDLAALIEVLDVAPAHVAANSFGASISLGLTLRRPDLVRSLCGHEPPLVGLVPDDPHVQKFLADAAEAVALIDAGDHEGGAREFVERVIGAGVWASMSPAERAPMAVNAQTFAGELRDPGSWSVDLDVLAASTVPIVLTRGDESVPFFTSVIERLAASNPAILVVETITGAGHEPHLTHPEAWIELVRRSTRES